MKRLVLWSPTLFVALLPGQDLLPPRQIIPNPTPALTEPEPHRARQAQPVREELDEVLFDQPCPAGPLLALGRSWKASFDAKGFAFVPFFGTTAPRNFPLRLELADARVGGEALQLSHAAPVRNGTAVHADRGACVETYETSLTSVKQSFVFASLPNRGTLSVALRIDTDLECSPIENGLRFVGAYGHVDYVKAIALDATGRSLPLAITWHKGLASMEVPADFVANAKLPLVIDPWLFGWWGNSSVTSQLQSTPDVATIQAEGFRTIVAWRQQFSMSDQDCFARIYTGVYCDNIAANRVVFDISGADWRHISVAGNNHAKNFMMVAEVGGDFLTPSFVVGRAATFAGVVGAQFDVARDSAGYPGSNTHPGIGSDPYPGEGLYCVAWCHEGRKIHYRVIRPSGVLPMAPGTLWDSSVRGLRPAVGKSCGSFNGLGSRWLVTWEAPLDLPPAPPSAVLQMTAFVEWTGTVTVPGGPLSLVTSGKVTAVAASSPVDVDGNRFWMAAASRDVPSSFSSDIGCVLIGGGSTLSFGPRDFFNLTAQEGLTPPDPTFGQQTSPTVDSDGIRFTIAYADSPLGSTNRDILASTVRYVPGSSPGAGALLFDAERVAIGTSVPDQSEVRLCAHYSGGNQGSSRFVITSRNLTGNIIHTDIYDAYAPGPIFTRRSTGCPDGPLTLAVSGLPVPGERLTLTLLGAPNAGFGMNVISLGTQGSYWIFGLACQCVLGGLNPSYHYGTQFTWDVPRVASLVGTNFSAQGQSYAMTSCLGSVAITSIVDFTIR